MNAFKNHLFLFSLLLTPITGMTQKYGHYNGDRLTERWIDFQMQKAELESYEAKLMEEMNNEQEQLISAANKAEQEEDYVKLDFIRTSIEELTGKYNNRFNQKAIEVDSIIQLKLQEGIDNVKNSYQLDFIFEAPGNIALYGDPKYDITLKLLSVLNGQKVDNSELEQFNTQKVAHISLENVCEQWSYYNRITEKLENLEREMQWEKEDYDRIRKKYYQGQITESKAKKSLAEIQKDMDKLGNEFDALNASFQEKLQRELEKALTEFNTSQGYDYIFDIDNVASGNTEYGADISDQFVKFLNGQSLHEK